MNSHPRILFVDHADSFSDNLIAALQARGCPVDRILSLPAPEGENLSLPPHIAALWSARAYQALVLSPGPLIPESYPFTKRLLDEWPEERPVLGVCLGHQMLLWRDGYTLGLVADRPVHGRLENIESVNPSRWLKDFVDGGFAAFYNSWAVHVSQMGSESGAGTWRLLSRSGDFAALAEHKTRPRIGVQYHPESFSSCRGAVLLDAFVALMQGAALD
ncbi:MAG: hypothetical protein EBR09_10525 [Proteobacteria bacterium]|nr:hypothetical protein [Pseudomonadota bacterium]